MAKIRTKKRNNKWLILTAGVVLAILLIAVAIIIIEGMNNGINDTPAPDFTVLDKDGNEVSLSDFYGKPIVLNFWASWCYYCVVEMPEFEEAYEENPDIVFLMVNVTDGYNETLNKAKSFIKESGYNFPVYFDTELDAAQTYGAESLPRTYFIDKTGEIVASKTGMITGLELNQKLSLIKE